MRSDNLITEILQKHRAKGFSVFELMCRGILAGAIALIIWFILCYLRSDNLAAVITAFGILFLLSYQFAGLPAFRRRGFYRIAWFNNNGDLARRSDGYSKSDVIDFSSLSQNQILYTIPMSRAIKGKIVCGTEFGYKVFDDAIELADKDNMHIYLNIDSQMRMRISTNKLHDFLKTHMPKLAAGATFEEILLPYALPRVRLIEDPSTSQ